VLALLFCTSVTFAQTPEAPPPAAPKTPAPPAREAFEYDPYRVVIWVATEPSPCLPTAVAADLAQRLAGGSDQIFGPVWEVSGAACPADLARLVAEASEITPEQIKAADEKLLAEADKLFLVGISCAESGGFQVAVREFDCRARISNEAVIRPAMQADNLCGVALAGIVQAFSPVVRIESVEDRTAITRLRAGGLVTDDSPAALKEGDILQPILRRNDRKGEPRENGIQRLPYSYLQVQKRDRHHVECLVYSGVRAAIAGRSGRTERMALLIRPNERGTRILLKSRSTPPTPLIEYDVFTRSIDGKGDLVPLGVTDQEGAVQLPLTEEPLKLVYVRHGDQMLTRVPMLAGYLPEQTITLNNDDQRLLAESFYLSIQNSIMDLIARREVLAARIKLRIEHDDSKGAQALLAELRNLQTRDGLRKEIEQQQIAFGSPDKNIQLKVDKMFAELRKLLEKRLDPKVVEDLEKEVKALK
jgi:hypothetical protein